MPFSTAILRALKLRCPDCGEGELFEGFFQMHKQCSHCEMRFEREPGYFIGACYVSFFASAALIILIVFLIGPLMKVDLERFYVPIMALCLVFALWFFRYSRSLWLGLERWVRRQGF